MTAESFRRAGNPAAAVDMCRDALIRFPGHLSARVTLGWALLDLGKLSDAQQEFEAVRGQAPDNLAAIRGLAKLHTLHDSDGFQEYEDADPAGDPADDNPPPAPSAAPGALDSLDDLDPFVAADPLESFDTLEAPETLETLESAAVFQLERWLARVEARRSEGLTECA
ncbi:MAG: tetratricopeptide repeat protein [Acidobacteria bacterium]|nr:tetratricopeptide repeat protein [Acidobacteriota bacterium]